MLSFKTLQLLALERRIVLVVVAVVDALHIDFPAVHLAPVHRLAQGGLEHLVQPDPGAAAVSLPEGVGNVDGAELPGKVIDLAKQTLMDGLQGGKGAGSKDQFCSQKAPEPFSC